MWKRLASSYEVMAYVYVVICYLCNKVDLKKDINYVYDSVMMSLLKYEMIGGVGDLYLAYVEMLKARSAVEYVKVLIVIGVYWEVYVLFVLVFVFVYFDL